MDANIEEFYMSVLAIHRKPTRLEALDKARMYVEKLESTWIPYIKERAMVLYTDSRYPIRQLRGEDLDRDIEIVRKYSNYILKDLIACDGYRSHNMNSLGSRIRLEIRIVNNCEFLTSHYNAMGVKYKHNIHKLTPWVMLVAGIRDSTITMKNKDLHHREDLAKSRKKENPNYKIREISH